MTNWISIKERLPYIDDFVLVFAKKESISEPEPISIARLAGGGTNWVFICGGQH